jgi:hypothetical protein
MIHNSRTMLVSHCRPGSENRSRSIWAATAAQDPGR